MDYLNRVREAVLYIEDHLQRKLTIDDVASTVGYSKFHFQRLFHHVSKQTIGQYILSRKLTEAARVLWEEQSKVVEIAYEYGFESHETFTRAFKNRFGMSPFAFKRVGKVPNHLLNKRLELDYLTHINDDVISSIEVVNLGELNLRGYKAESGKTKDIHQAWRKLLLKQRNSHEGSKFAKYGLIQYSEIDELELNYSYLAATTMDGIEREENQQELVISPSKYVVFDHKGDADRLPLTYQYIYGTWFSENPYSLVESYDFEFYGESFSEVSSRDSIIRIFIPVND
ncbi:hypothetical protein PGLA_20230 [Paenibacillus glacialis]|uniref:HTH araC/xylS-type domain-containing protein n=1 Tax=Paenibacillus glacialis TaxID=494026 RepID=A0A168HQC9_9BACL|nr:hypothetical protein PGLA_20230 [Paenibacillus glacialis]